MLTYPCNLDPHLILLLYTVKVFQLKSVIFTAVKISTYIVWACRRNVFLMISKKLNAEIDSNTVQLCLPKQGELYKGLIR